MLGTDAREGRPAPTWTPCQSIHAHNDRTESHIHDPTTDTPMRNGVDTATLFATLDAVKGNPEIAKFQFRATNRWVSGTHNQSTIHGFYGARQEMTAPAGRRRFDADHPAVLVGHGQRPDPGRVPAARPRRLPHRRASPTSPRPAAST